MKTQREDMIDSMLAALPKNLHDSIMPHIARMADNAWWSIQKSRNTLASCLAKKAPIKTKTHGSLSSIDITYHKVTVGPFSMIINSGSEKHTVIFEEDFMNEAQELSDRIASALLSEIRKHKLVSIRRGSEADFNIDRLTDKDVDEA